MERALATQLAEEGVADSETWASVRLSGRGLRLARVAWMIVTVAALAIFITALPAAVTAINQGAFLEGHQGTIANNPDADPSRLDIGVTALGVGVGLGGALVSLILALIIFWRRSDDGMAVFVSFYLLFIGIVNNGPLELMEFYLPGVALFTTDVLTPFSSTTLSVILLCLFPDGRFVPRWTRWLPLASLIMLPVALYAYFHFGQFLTSPIMLAALPVWAFTVLLAFYAQIYRYRLVSSPTERQQTMWIVYGFGLYIILSLLSVGPYMQGRNLAPGETLPLWWVLFGVFAYLHSLIVMPAALTIAVLRYRLYDIDILINRTLVYGALTAAVIGIYVAIVGSLGAVFHAGGNLAISLIGTGIAAASFQPMRERLQQGVNRLMFGERDEPYTVLRRLSERLEAVVAPHSVLPTIIETVAEALKLPYVAIALRQEGSLMVVAEYPNAFKSDRRPGDDAETLPLAHQSETIGQLILGRRGRGERFSQTDWRLLETIARQAGIAAYNVRLTQDLQRSRERLVTTREEERRRLRRDLHDGLGPALAAMSFRLDAIYNRIEHDPQTARHTVTDLKGQVQEALDDIRRIAYDLRPPALDELGLAGALKEHIAGYNQGQGLRIRLEAPAELPPLPAAVEAAAYRIALEALTNVSRHAGARECRVKLWLAGDIWLEVADDGRGIAATARAGVGMTSMRERAEELGGSCGVETLPEGGSRVLVHLPLSSGSIVDDEESVWKWRPSKF